MNQKNRVKIFDTTLRDGQQCPGAGMTFEQNLRYAHLATRLGIDVLEAGFPSASKVDFDIVREIANQLASIESGPVVAGLCQLRREQVEKTIESLLPAVPFKKARMHVYLPVSPALIQASLGDKALDKNGLVKDVEDFVRLAVNAGLEVEFSPEGYSQMGENIDFVTDAIRAAVVGGASVINCPDTLGGACEYQGEEYFVNKMSMHAAVIAEEFPERDITWSMHCHNDFGLAVENSINGVFRGPARQIEGCINGVGERAGNAALEQVIMVIKHFGHLANPEAPFHTRIKTEMLQEVCDFIGKYMLPRQPHWPICGDNAAKHSSGGHTNAILSNPQAYQPFDPAEVGKNISFLFGPLSGGNHAKSIIEERGYICEEAEKAEVAQYIKDLYADRRKGITDTELLQGYFQYRAPIKVTEIDYSRSSNRSMVELKGEFFGETGTTSERNEGPDSALAALKIAVDKRFGPLKIQSHRSESEGKDINAVSVSTIVVSNDQEQLFTGVGRDQDIEISAMKAFIAAVNTAYVESQFRKEQR